MKKHYEYTSDGARIIQPLYLITDENHEGLLTGKEIKKRDQIESWYSAKMRLEKLLKDDIEFYNEDNGPVYLSLIINDEDRFSNKSIRFALRIANIVLSNIENSRIRYLNEEYEEYTL